MVTIQILCVGKLKEKYLQSACEEYAKRLGAFCRFSITEIAEERLPDAPSEAQIQAALKKEGEHLLSLAQGAVISLCIEGKLLSSPQLAAEIERRAVGGASAFTFIIGSSFGLSDDVKEKSALRLSMSPMTFPHQLARVMLCEQIYRAFQINSNGKYHK